MSNFKATKSLASDLIKMPIQDYRPLVKSKIQVGKHQGLRALTPFSYLGKLEVWSIPSLPDGAVAFTAFTDGWNVFFCKEFLDTLTQKQINFVFCHELCHILLKHVFICKKLFKIDAELTAISADYQVNDWLDILDPNRICIEFIDGCLHDESFRGWSPLKIFKHLQKKKEEAEKDGGVWEPDGEPTDEMQFDGNLNSGGDDGDTDEKTVAEKAKDAENMMSQLNDMIAHAKHLIQEGSPEVNKMMDSEMAIEVKWQPMFEEIVMQSQYGADDQTYSIYNPRNVVNADFFEEDVIYPSDYSETVGEIIMAFDASGSIVEETKVFIEQVQEIMERLRPESVRVLFWDTKVVSDELYLPKDYQYFKDMVMVKGGGGTNAQCVPQYLEDNPHINWEACVFFTDGALYPIDWNPHKPVLWLVVTQDGTTDFKPTQGKMVPYIPEKNKPAD